MDDLKACGLSTRKSEYVIATSRMTVSGELDLEGMKQLPDDDVLDRLTAVRGIGRWTAEMTMLRGMGKLAAFPADDLGLRALIATYYGDGGAGSNGPKKDTVRRPRAGNAYINGTAPRRRAAATVPRVSAESARRIAEPWGEWKGLAIYYLLVARMRRI